MVFLSVWISQEMECGRRGVDYTEWISDFQAAQHSAKCTYSARLNFHIFMFRALVILAKETSDDWKYISKHRREEFG